MIVWIWARIGVIGILILQEIWSQEFIRRCDDPAIGNPHQVANSHSYCHHACGGLQNAMVLDECDSNGNCICTLPCSDDPTPSPLGTDLCNKMPPDPPDSSMPNRLMDCGTFCTQKCPGGIPGLCAELVDLVNSANQLAYASICTCSCPAIPCPPDIPEPVTPIIPSLPSPPSTTMTPEPSPPPPTQKSISIIIIPNIHFLITPLKFLALLFLIKFLFFKLIVIKFLVPFLKGLIPWIIQDLIE